jgi:hypothetical protein
MITDGNLFDALQAINWSYGRGGLIGFDPITQTVTRRIPTTQRTGFLETRRYAVKGNQLRFLGHTRKLAMIEYIGWKAASNGAAKRHWFVMHHEERRYYRSEQGQLVWFGSRQTAQRKADQLNKATKPIPLAQP